MTSASLPARRDLKLTSKLVEMGFTKAYSVGKLLVLSLGGESKEFVADSTIKTL